MMYLVVLLIFFFLILSLLAQNNFAMGHGQKMFLLSSLKLSDMESLAVGQVSQFVHSRMSFQQGHVITAGLIFLTFFTHGEAEGTKKKNILFLGKSNKECDAFSQKKIDDFLMYWEEVNMASVYLK